MRSLLTFAILALMCAAASADLAAPIEPRLIPDTAAAPTADDAAPDTDDAAAPAPDEAAADFENTPLPVSGQAPAPPSIPPVDLLDTLKLVVPLVVVIGLVVVAAWAFRRFAPRTSSMFSSDLMKILARTYLAPRQVLYLVRVPGKVLVIGSTQQSLTPLAEITDPAEVERLLALFEKNSPKGATETFRSFISAASSPGGAKGSAESELASTVENVSERVALLSRKLEDFEKDLN